MIIILIYDNIAAIGINDTIIEIRLELEEITK